MSGIVGTSHSKSKVVGRSQDTAKAWVNFNGTSTVAIRDSFNVSSITDEGTGDYSVTFSANMTSGNYAIFASSIGNTTSYLSQPFGWGSTSPSVSGFRFQTPAITDLTMQDIAVCHCAVFGD